MSGCNNILPHGFPYEKNCSCCEPHYPSRIPKPKFPVNEYMYGNALSIIDNVPYVVDNTNVTYGHVLSVSENINTMVSQHRDCSCVMLSGSLDLTSRIITNTVWKQFIVDTIGNDYMTMEGLINVLKSNVKFKLFYTITDFRDEEVYRSSCEVTAQSLRFHETDVHDYFVTSTKNVFFTNIPKMSYDGIYSIRLDKVVAYVDVIETKRHILNTMNPFYQFTSNNTKITIQHDTCQKESPDKTIVIGECEINKSFAFQANLTTRLKFTFIAYMSNYVFFDDTLDIYTALHNPTSQTLDNLVRTVSTMQEEMYLLQQKVEELSKTNAYDYIRKIEDYKYEVGYTSIDYEFGKEFLKQYNGELGGCTTVRIGNFFARNFDWYYDNTAYFIARIESGENVKYSSICNCGNIKELTNTFVESHAYSDKYKALPFMALDGRNEKNLYASINIVPYGDWGVTTGTTPLIEQRDEICEIMIVRYILDNFATAQEAVEYIQNYVSVYGLTKIKQEIHCMVADMDNTYIIEFLNNECVVINMNDEKYANRKFMTNFYVKDSEIVETNVDDDVVYNLDKTSVTPYSTGVERYDYLLNNQNNVTDANSMLELMYGIKFTNAYTSENPVWYSEFCDRGMDLKVTDPYEKFEPYVLQAKEAFVNRSRDHAVTWQTVHTAVYDMTNGMMYLINQEEPLSDVKGFTYIPYYTKYEVDNMEKQEEIDPIILSQSTGVTIDFDTNMITRHGININNCEPFQRKRCNVTNDGMIVAYYGDEGYTETGALTSDITVGGKEYVTGTPVQTMVYQPKTYYKVEPLKLSKITDGEGYHIRKARYFVSNQQLPGFKLHPAFINESGDEVDYILISAFEGSAYDVSESTYITDDSQTVDFTLNTGDMLSSIGAQTKPISGTTQELTRANAEILANNRGDGWYLYNIKIAALNQLLALIEYGNCQTNIGRGIVDISSRTLETNCSSYTGSTIGNGSGNAVSTINEINGSEVTYTENGKVAVNYRGMENPWGNMYEHVNGMNIFNGVPYICKDFNYSETKHDGNYISTNITIPDEVGYIKYFGYGNYEYDWLFVPSAIGGSADNCVGDYLIINPTTAGHRVPIIGGSWADNNYAGIQSCNTFNLTGYFGCNVSARIVYYPSTQNQYQNINSKNDNIILQQSVFKAPYEKFPEKGEPNVLYIDTNDWEMFVWDENTGMYVSLSTKEFIK